jgi:hypothetical protein
MGAVEKAFPNLKPEEILAKAHAQLLLEIQKKEIGWNEFPENTTTQMIGDEFILKKKSIV